MGFPHGEQDALRSGNLQPRNPKTSVNEGVSAPQSVTNSTLSILLAERDMAEAIAIVSAARMGEEPPYPIEPRHYRALATIALEMAPWLDLFDWQSVQRELLRGGTNTQQSQ